MSAIFAQVKADTVTAIAASTTISPFSLGEPILAEAVWSDLDYAPDSRRVAFLHDGKQALANAYHYYMEQRLHSFEFDIYETIHQNLFTRSVFPLLLKRANVTLDSAQVSSQLFMFFVAGLARSLSPTEFTAWFAAVFGPLISAAEVVLSKALGLEGNDAGERHKDKKARLEQESKFHRSYTLFRGIRDLQSDARARQIQGRERRAVVRELPVESAVEAPRRGSWNSAHGLKRLASRTSEGIQRVVGALAQASRTPMAPPPSAATFAPRLDPKPLIMPGSVPTPRQSQDAFSRFPRRSASSGVLPVHFCPLALSFKSSKP